MQTRIFGGGLLVAAEETRSRAGGQHAQVLPRAHALGTRARPALGSWRLLRLAAGAHLHGFSVNRQHTMQHIDASTCADASFSGL